MDLLSTGTFVGAGSFCCRNCGYVLTLNGVETLSDCPGCGGTDFARASLFNVDPDSPGQETARHGGMLSSPPRTIATRSWPTSSSGSSSPAST